MSSMLRLEDEERAVALVELAEGNVSQGILGVLEQYGYLQDTNSDFTYWLSDANGGIGLRFSADWTEVLVVGNSTENLENLNYILKRSGWDSAKVVIKDPNAERDVLSSFSSLVIVSVDNIEDLDPDAQGAEMVAPGPANTAPVPASPRAERLGAPPPENDRRPIATTRQPVATQPAETQAERVALPKEAPGDERALAAIVENLLLAQVKASLGNNDLAAQLEAAGYDLRVVIRPKAR